MELHLKYEIEKLNWLHNNRILWFEISPEPSINLYLVPSYIFYLNYYNDQS